MAVTLQHLIEIDELVAGQNDPSGFASGAEEFRRRMDDLVVLRCDASDVLEEPFRTYPWFDLHLIDGSSHCPRITGDPERAGGILLAWRGKA